MTIDLNESDLLARMRNFEDHLVERKTVKDEKDWKKTAVAFANSAPVGLPAILYIGVRNNGEIETPQRDLDEIQRKFNTQMQRVFPRIAYVPKIISEDGQQALAVVIPGSELRPHFAGLSYVRKGSETIDASEEQFGELLAQRNSKAALILKSKGNNVTVINRFAAGQTQWPNSTVLIDCNQFYVTLQPVPHEPPSSFPLSRVEINADNLRRRLQLEILEPGRNPWNEELEWHVRQVLENVMNREGQSLLRWLLIQGRIECPQQFMTEISLRTQNEQMEIAVSNGMVRREKETTGMQLTFYVVNSEMRPVLERVVPEVLKGR